MSEFHHEAGKGSRFRDVENQKQFEENWDRIFGKKDKDDNSLSGHGHSGVPNSSSQRSGTS